MKPTLTEAEQVELDLINREIKSANLMMKLYVWIVLPAVFTLLGLMVWSQL